MDPSADRPWWITNYEGTGYVERYGHHDGEKTRRDIDFIIRYAGLTPGHLVLDLCCAFGRHVRELTRRGFSRAIGVDLSADLLRFAKQSSTADGENINLVRADIRVLPFTQIDVAMLLFGSFGFLETDEANQAVLTECARTLRPGGVFAMDLFLPHPIVTSLQNRVVEGPNATVTQQVSWDSAVCRLNRSTVSEFHDGSTTTTRSSVRLYRPSELRTALEVAGLVIEHEFGGYDGRAVTEHGDRYVVLARRPS